MDSDIEHCRVAAIEAEIFVNYFFGSRVLDLAALAGRKLAHQRRIDPLATMSDAGDVHERRNTAMSHVTGIFAERSFRLDPLGRYFALDYDLRSRGNMQIHSLAADHFDGLACQSTGESIFIEIVGQFGGGGVRDGGNDADHDGGLQRNSLRLTPPPVLSHVLSEKKPAVAIRGFDLAAVVADIKDSRIRILGHPVGRTQIRTI